MVKEFSAANDTVHIRRLLKVLGQDFINSQNAHTRRGGLIGLAAISIGLGKVPSAFASWLICLKRTLQYMFYSIQFGVILCFDSH